MEKIMEKGKQLEDWIEAHTQSLLRLAYSFVRDWSIAEDQVQNAFIKAYRWMDRSVTVRAPYSWLARIVINECTSYYRKSRRELTTADMPDLALESTEDTYLRHAALQEVYDAVRKLPDRLSKPMVLFYFNDLPVDQIAKLLTVNAGTVRTRLSRGRERLRKQRLLWAGAI
ncbi:MAG: hypothetical protein K0S39_4181 [Paenibacillus sp.]|nr:hypothetical protein [Paenibacillus sp.]